MWIHIPPWAFLPLPLSLHWTGRPPPLSLACLPPLQFAAPHSFAWSPFPLQFTTPNSPPVLPGLRLFCSSLLHPFHVVPPLPCRLLLFPRFMWSPHYPHSYILSPASLAAAELPSGCLLPVSSAPPKDPFLCICCLPPLLCLPSLIVPCLIPLPSPLLFVACISCPARAPPLHCLLLASSALPGPTCAVHLRTPCTFDPAISSDPPFTAPPLPRTLISVPQSQSK